MASMTSRASNFCIDAVDPYTQVKWWSQVLDDFRLLNEAEMGPDEEECWLVGPDDREIIFARVPGQRSSRIGCISASAPPTARGRKRSNESLRWAPHSSPIGVTAPTRGGRCSPIPRATSSAFSPATPQEVEGAHVCIRRRRLHTVEEPTSVTPTSRFPHAEPRGCPRSSYRRRRSAGVPLTCRMRGPSPIADGFSERPCVLWTRRRPCARSARRVGWLSPCRS